MKKSELIFSSFLAPLDFVMIVLAGITAYNIRFTDFVKDIRPVVFQLPFDFYMKAVLLIAFFWLIVFALAGLYNIKSARKLVKEVYLVVQACSTGLMLVIVLIFIRRELFDSRFIVLAVWIISIIYVSLGRILIRNIQRILFSYDIGVKKVILVGSSKTGDKLVAKFSKDKKFGFKVIKRVRDFQIETAKELEELMALGEVDEIIQSDPNLSKAEVLRLYDFADENHLVFKYVADLLGTKVLRTELMEFAGIPIIEVKKTQLEGWGRIIKRIFDIICSSILIIIFSPVLVITAIAIKIESPGPIFFSKKDDDSPLFRVGQKGELFHYFKFRSMKNRSDSMRYNELAGKDLRKDGPLVKIKDDPRVTKIGRLIRRFSIDELPEFFSVLIGNMSLVGPRPHLPEEVAKYDRRHKKVLTIKPGITGLAQVSGRSDLSFEEEVKLDTYYIENWSFLFDIAILLRTPFAVFKNRKTE